jgi:hypothetical protein
MGRTYKITVLSSLLSLVGVLLMLGLILVTMLIAHADSVANAFAPYQDFVPGQQLAELDLTDCSQASSWEGQVPNRRICALFPEDGPLNMVFVDASADVITEVRFYSESLQLGDLIAQWQEPDSYIHGRFERTVTRSRILLWNKENYTVSAIVIILGQPPYVRNVTLKASKKLGASPITSNGHG